MARAKVRLQQSTGLVPEKPAVLPLSPRNRRRPHRLPPGPSSRTVSNPPDPPPGRPRARQVDASLDQSSSSFPLWAIIVCAVGGAVALGLLAWLSWRCCCARRSAPRPGSPAGAVSASSYTYSAGGYSHSSGAAYSSGYPSPGGSPAFGACNPERPLLSGGDDGGECDRCVCPRRLLAIQRVCVLGVHTDAHSGQVVLCRAQGRAGCSVCTWAVPWVAGSTSTHALPACLAHAGAYPAPANGAWGYNGFHPQQGGAYVANG